jgi:hypothetical protein
MEIVVLVTVGGIRRGSDWTSHVNKTIKPE